MFSKVIEHGCLNHPRTESVVYCTECKLFFCKDCETKHNIDYGKRHKIIPAPVADQCLQGGKCFEHIDTLLNSFCRDCFGKT